MDNYNNSIISDDEFYDENGKKYTNVPLFRGLTKYIVTGGGAGVDGFESAGGTIGSGQRAEVIRALGFNERPTQSECSAKMATIRIEAYPTRNITVHKSLVNEVQTIFKNLKMAGVQLNQYIGGYCYRTVNNPLHPNSTVLSMHSFGCAIDINYNLNPFVGGGRPLSSGDDTTRGVIRTYNSPIVKAFAANGWGWGGRYGDYMHFSKANGS